MMNPSAQSTEAHIIPYNSGAQVTACFACVKAALTVHWFLSVTALGHLTTGPFTPTTDSQTNLPLRIDSWVVYRTADIRLRIEYSSVGAYGHNDGSVSWCRWWRHHCCHQSLSAVRHRDASREQPPELTAGGAPRPPHHLALPPLSLALLH